MVWVLRKIWSFPLLRKSTQWKIPKKTKTNVKASNHANGTIEFEKGV